MRVVVAVPSRDTELSRAAGPTYERQYIREAAAALADLAGHHQLVVTHGVSPHLELLLREDALVGEAVGFDVLTAESEAATGYLLAQELRNTLPDSRVVVLLTQVRVDPNDPEFRQPSAPIGPAYAEERARVLSAGRGWLMGPEGGGWRRLVAAPAPLAVIEADAVELLLEAGVVVVCGGGGGIPVISDFAGNLRGVTAVVPAARAAATLARQIDADRLVFLIDSAPEDRVGDVGVEVLAASEALLAGSGDPPDGLRRAAAEFAVATGRSATIGPLHRARQVLDGEAGVVIVADTVSA